MRANKLLSGLSGGLAMAALTLMPLSAMAAGGPGTATSNLTTVSTGYVADATGPAEAESNAEFTVEPGSLTLNTVPNIQLGGMGVKSIATGSTSLPLVAGNTTGGTGYDGSGTDTVNVTDYRGDHDGWALTVGMGPFTTTGAGSNDTASTATLDLVAAAGTMDNTATSDPAAKLTLSQSAAPTSTTTWITNPQTFWTAAADTGEGDNNADITSGTAVNMTKDSMITAGTYTATLYWALQNAPTTSTTPAA